MAGQTQGPLELTEVGRLCAVLICFEIGLAVTTYSYGRPDIPMSRNGHEGAGMVRRRRVRERWGDLRTGDMPRL
jgi:hypothetical protein